MATNTETQQNDQIKKTESVLTDVQKDLLKSIEENKIDEFKKLLEAHERQAINFVDDDKMTMLQQAAYRGNTEIVDILLKKGADVNKCEHENEYTSLHFGALSGNVDVCKMLLEAGVKTNALNSINRTPSQLASFVGYHSIVSTINNFIPREDVEYYTKIQGTQTKPYLSPELGDNFYKLALLYNLHPIKIAMLLKQYDNLLKHLDDVQRVFELMSEREMKRKESNEVLAFKFYYIAYNIHKISKTLEKHDENTFVEEFAKPFLKPNADGEFHQLDKFLREGLRIFPFLDSTLFRQIITSLTGDNSPPAMQVVTAAVNGQRAFSDDLARCETCGEEKAPKKCAKCKEASYCDRECQKLHWFVHKKGCGKAPKKPISKNVDANQLSQEIKGLLTSN